MLDNLTPASVHEPLTQKLSVFKFRAEWLIVDIPAGIVVARRYTWPLAIEFADHYIRAALTPEVCS